MARSIRHQRPPEHGAARLVFVIIAVLATLAGLAYFGTSMYERAAEQRRVTALMGRKGNFTPLPALDLHLGARSLELKVILELKPKVSPRVADRQRERIVDQLYDDIRQIEPEDLVGPGSAERVKQSVTRAVQRETGRDIVKEVLIERMVVK